MTRTAPTTPRLAVIMKSMIPMQVFVLVAVVWMSVPANAQRLAEKITPQVVQRGSEAKVLLEGNYLENVEGILAYSPGIQFIRVEPPGDVGKMSPVPTSTDPGKQVTLVLGIDDNAVVGEHLFRVRTKETLSEILTVWVSPFPCVREAHPFTPGGVENADTLESAQEIKLNTTYWGHFPGHSNFDEDFYRIDLKKGERLTVEVWGSCFSSPIDPSLTLYGPDKKPILMVDDTTLRESDPFFSYIATTTGTHYVAIHPFNDDENGLGHYAIHFTNGLRPTIAYPLGGQPGEKLKTTLYGDVEGNIDIDLQLPASVSPYEKSIISHAPKGSIIPLRFHVAGFPNILEAQGDHGREENAQHYNGSLPIAFNGKIEKEGETDWYRFSAKAGERYLVRSFAGTFGSPIDPYLKIKPAKGTESQIALEADDSTWLDHDWCSAGRWRCKDLADPIVVFEPDVDGDYLLGISDNQRLFGPDYAYRVEFQPARNRIWLQNTSDYRESIEKRDAIVVHAGSNIERTYNVLVPPITDFEGEFDIVIEGLPKGVTYLAPRASANSRIVQLIFSAAPETKPWAGFPEIKLRPVDKNSQLDGGYRYVHTRSIMRGGLASGFYRRTDRFALAVVGPAPLSVTVEKPDVGLALNAFVDLKINVGRSHGFDGAVVIRSRWTPEHILGAPPLTIPAGQSSAMYRVTASSRATPGSFPLTLTAHEESGTAISTGLGFHFVSSTPVNVEVVEPYLEITLARSAIERGTDGFIQGKIKHIRPLPAGTTATLTNLPTGVKLLNDVNITGETAEVSFSIRATSAALLGLAEDISCHVTVLEGGQAIVQSTGVATLRIDQERKP